MYGGGARGSTGGFAMFARSVVARFGGTVLATVLAVGGLSAGLAMPAQAAGAATLSMQIAGYGRVAVGSETTSPPNCQAAASTPQSTVGSCGDVDGTRYDTCTSDGSGGAAW